MPFDSRAEHEIVARRAPRGLLGDRDVGQPVFVEEALFLGDDERRGVGQRDEAEHHLRDFGARGLREHAGRKGALRGGHQRGGAGEAGARA